MARQPRKTPRQPRKQMGVTLPSELRDRLEAAAGKAERSIGEEIRLRLERTFRQDAASSLRKASAFNDLWKRIFALAAVAEFATGRKWSEDPGVAYLLQLSIDHLLQRRYGASEIGEISTTEVFRREVVPHTDPAPLASAIETYINTKLVIDHQLDEAYRRGGATEEERVASQIEREIDEVYASDR